MTKHYYKHLGYYNQVGDIKAIGDKSADEILSYWKNGYGAFYESKGHEEDTDVCLEDEKAYDEVITDSTKEYLIINNKIGWPSWNRIYKNKEDGDDGECFIDIYRLYKIEEDGKVFLRTDYKPTENKRF